MKTDMTWRTTGRPLTGQSVAARKLLRCLTLLKTLEVKRMTIREMAEQLEMTERTVYRYVALFEEAGYIIDSDFNHKFFIVNPGRGPGQAYNPYK